MIAATRKEARKIEAYSAEMVTRRADYIETREQFATLFRTFLIVRGWTYYTARIGADGNCLTCGEAGRCPGSHVLSREDDARRPQLA